MSWSRFARILRTGPLDRETKLMLIDLLAGVKNAKLEEEIFRFIFAWEEAEAQTQKHLLEGIDRITNRYEATKENLDARIQKAMLSIADDLARQSKIRAIKKSINDL